MAVMSAYSNNALVMPNRLFALETESPNSRARHSQHISPAFQRLLETSLGEIRVCVDAYQHQAEIPKSDDAKYYQLIVVQQGRVDLRVNHTALSLSDGQVCLVNVAQTCRAVVAAGSRVATISVPDRLLNEDALHLGYHLRVPGLVFKPEVFKLEQLAVLKHQILSLLDDSPDQTPDELKVQYRRFFSSLLLQRFEHNSDLFYKVTSCDNPKIEKIRRWVISSPREEYKPSDLAAYINVSERSLYHLFKKKYGLSPRVYICHIKLECIYRELMCLDNAKNITQVALEYGFNNLGRFSRVYREYFGESPSETCKR